MKNKGEKTIMENELALEVLLKGWRETRQLTLDWIEVLSVG